MSSRNLFAGLVLPGTLLVAGCPGPLRGANDSEDAAEAPNDFPEGPPARIDAVDSSRGEGKTLGARLAVGDRIVRHYVLVAKVSRVGSLEGLSDQELVGSTLYREQRSRDEILSIAEGRPASIRRTFFDMSEKKTAESASGRVQAREEPEVAETAVMVLEEIPGGDVRMDVENLPIGIVEADLEPFAILDLVALAGFVPARPASPGEEWTVPIGRIADILGRRQPGALQEGRIVARYAHPVSYGGELCAHIELTVQLDESTTRHGDRPVSTRTRWVLGGELYYSLDAGHPRYLRLSGPTTIDYEPQGAIAEPSLARAFTMQGEMKIDIQFERLP